VAGVGKMNYRRFITFNIIGGILWVVIFFALGAIYGNIPFVKNNFEIVTLGIVFISVLPMIFEFVRARRTKAAVLPGEVGDAS
jgi:membrane-associated protein